MNNFNSTSTSTFKKSGAKENSTSTFKKSGAKENSTSTFKKSGAKENSTSTFKKSGAKENSTSTFKKSGAKENSTFKKSGAKEKANSTFKKRKIGKNNSKSTRGGKVIASGGYGCIFRPALKCVNKARAKNQISKLMTLKHINEEYNDIIKFKPFLQKIPNYQNYFFVDKVYACKPDKLTESDLKDFDKTCKAMKKDGFYKNNINNSLNKVALINMPDGGLDVGDYIDDITKTDELIKLNNSLIDLLLNGIIPMNKMNIYHCDIKESNILVNEKEGVSTKLIDWGLSAMFDGKKIPEPILERPFQYNLPFSIILFNDIFKKSYEKLLKINPNPDYFAIRAFVVNYIFLWNEKRGPGHVKYMINIMEKLFENDLQNINLDNRKEIVEMEFLYFYIINYLTKILVQFTKNREFMQMEYFTNIFLKNIDVWGLVMSYYPILNILHSNYKVLDKTELRLFHKLKYIFLHYLFENSTEPIDIGSLINDLRDLNIYFESANKNAKQKKSPTTFKKSTAKKDSTKKNRQPRTIVFIETKGNDSFL